MKKVHFKPFSHKKGCSTKKMGNPKYTRKLALTEFHSLKRNWFFTDCPLHDDHWYEVARFKHDSIVPKKARTARSWKPLKFAVRLAVVTKHYLKYLDNK